MQQEASPIHSPLAIAILAGGLSTRMGVEKSFVRLNGIPLIAHVLKRLESLQRAYPDAPLFIVSNNISAFAAYGRPVLPDVLPMQSSLNGLYSALWHSPGRHTLCVACDMPFVEPTLLHHLIDSTEGWQAALPRVGNHIETLCAVYDKSCNQPFYEALHTGSFKIRAVIESLHVRYVEADVLRQFDPLLNSFVNLNTPEDVAGINQI